MSLLSSSTSSSGESPASPPPCTASPWTVEEGVGAARLIIARVESLLSAPYGDESEGVLYGYLSVLENNLLRLEQAGSAEARWVRPRFRELVRAFNALSGGLFVPEKARTPPAW